MRSSFYPPRGIRRSVAPASEPVTLAEARLYLRVEHTSDDALIALLIRQARETVEHYLRQSVITQTWQITYDLAAPESIRLPMGPVQSITSVVSIASNNAQTALSSNLYHLDASERHLCFTQAVMGHKVRITYVAGFGATSEDVPAPIRQAILAQCAALYDDRSAESLSVSARALLHPFREGAL